ncbi:MAG: S8 family serine peptidase [Planctomycetota bacterium]|jgi:subtilisin family serine protease
MSNTRHRSSWSLGILALAVLGIASGPVAGQVPDPLVSGRAIVRLLDGVAIGDFIAQFEADHAAMNLGLAASDTIAAHRMHLLAFDAGGLTEQQLDQLEIDFQSGYPTYLVWGELLYEAHDPEGNTGSLWFHSVEGSVSFGNQYAAGTLGLDAAHAQASGLGTLVAVLDTGIDTSHPLLAGNIAPGGFNFIAGNDDVVDLVNGHGTFVAGLVHLVAPDAQLLPVVVLDSDGIGDAWLLTKGLFHAIDAGAEVINLSLGSTYNSEAVGDAMETAKMTGITVVSAGGNWGLGGDVWEEFPAAFSNGLGVASVDDLDVKAAFSNYNSKFAISAPGTSIPQGGTPDGFDPDRTIYSTLPADLGPYGIWEGTSFSTAFVSGAAALLRAQHPEWPQDETTERRVQRILEVTAVNIDSIPANAPYSGELGAGRLDAAAALALGAGDLDLDGVVGIVDFLTMLAAWGPCPIDDDCLADLDGDGTVGVTDFLFLLSNWS